MKSQLILLIMAGLNFPACTPLQPYRLGDDSIKDVSPRSGYPYKIGFVEFDDQGEHWARDQVQRVMDDIQKETASEPHLVLVFTHGWMNDASPRSEKKRILRRYKEALAIISEYYQQSSQKKKVYGVFVAWRGASTYLPPFNLLSFYNRKAAAQRIGSGSAISETITNLGRSVSSEQDNRTILIGHSFGCILVENAIHQTLAVENGNPARKDYPFDRVFLVNSAQRSIVSKQLIDALKHHGSQRKDPPLISITSTADKATGLAFPFGQSFSKPFRRLRNHANYQVGDPWPSSQFNTYLHTSGHEDSLFSHKLEKISESTMNDSVDTIDMMLSNSQSAGSLGKRDSHEYQTNVGRFRLEAIPEAYNSTPYWIFQVPRELVPSHGDIFEPQFLVLLAGLSDLEN